MSSRESLRDQAMRWRLMGCVYRGSYVVETRDVSLENSVAREEFEL